MSEKLARFTEEMRASAGTANDSLTRGLMELNLDLIGRRIESYDASVGWEMVGKTVDSVLSQLDRKLGLGTHGNYQTEQQENLQKVLPIIKQMSAAVLLKVIIELSENGKLEDVFEFIKEHGKTSIQRTVVTRRRDPNHRDQARPAAPRDHSRVRYRLVPGQDLSKSVR